MKRDTKKLREIVEGPAYAMDIKLAAALAKFTGRPETECLHVLRSEIMDTIKVNQGRKKEERAIRFVCESAVRWLEEADEYAVTDLIGFIFSHNQVCVWAVLVGKEMAKRGE